MASPEEGGTVTAKIIDLGLAKPVNEPGSQTAIASERRSEHRKVSLESRAPKGKPTGRVAWLRGKANPGCARANKARWAADPEKLRRTVEKMNAARLAVGISDQSRRKMSRSQKRRWRSMSPEQVAGQMAQMRAGRPKRFIPR